MIEQEESLYLIYVYRTCSIFGGHSHESRFIRCDAHRAHWRRRRHKSFSLLCMCSIDFLFFFLLSKTKRKYEINEMTKFDSFSSSRKVFSNYSNRETWWWQLNSFEKIGISSEWYCWAVDGIPAEDGWSSESCWREKSELCFRYSWSLSDRPSPKRSRGSFKFSGASSYSFISLSVSLVTDGPIIMSS